MTQNEFNMIMESLVERYNNGEITYTEASKVEDKVRADYAKDKAVKKALKQQKLAKKVNDAVSKKVYNKSMKYAKKCNKLENKKNRIYDRAGRLIAQAENNPETITGYHLNVANDLVNKYAHLNAKENNLKAASQKYNDKVKQRGENRKLRGSMGTKNYLAAKANQAKNKLFKAHEGAMDDYDMTRLEVFEAYENGVINEAEKYELLNTLESAGEFGDYPTEDMLYKDAQPEKIFSQVEDRQAINNPVSALNNNAASSYDDTTSINPEFDDYSVKAADKEIVTKESVMLDIFDAYEAGEITEADKYELLAMIDD